MPRTTLPIVAGLLAGSLSQALLSQVTVEFVRSSQQLPEGRSYATALGDLNGDGHLDAFVTDTVYFPNSVWLNDGNGNFTDTGQALGSSDSFGVALADIDGDDDLDALVANYSNQPNTVWFNDGNGNFTDSKQRLGTGASYVPVMGDLDDDGHLDVVFPNALEPDTMWLNDGNGVFTQAGPPPGDEDSIGVAIGDLNGDDALDMWISDIETHDRVWFNDGNGNFTDSGQVLADENSFETVLADLNGDGHLDAWLRNSIEQDEGDDIDFSSVWFNDGDGNFTDSGQVITYAPGIATPAFGDFDQDGDLDAYIASGGPNIRLVNDGTGHFTNSGVLMGYDRNIAATIGDLDGDGRLDVWCSSYNRPDVIWFNRPLIACCFDDGCLQIHIGDCELIGGTWVSGSCFDSGCPGTEVGACCVTEGCLVMGSDDCTTLGGTWLAAGACDDCPASCPGDLDGDGEVGPKDLAVLLGAWGVCP